jgi:hypothetical protein
MMKTRIPIQMMVGLCAMLSLGASAQTYVTLVSKQGVSSQTIELTNGMVATVVHLRTSGAPAPAVVPVPSGSDGYLEVVVNGTYFTYAVTDLLFGHGNSPSNAVAANLPVITAPARLTLKTGPTAAGNAVCTLSIGQPVPPNVVPKDVVSIPSVWGNSANLILQSSSDLFTWDTTTIGTYGPPLTNRFFRLLVQPTGP